MRFNNFIKAGLYLVTAALLGACNSGGSTTAASTTTTVVGMAVAAPVTGSVVVKSNGKVVANGNVSAGAFNVSLPNVNLSGELLFEVTGTYTDEVSSQSVTLDAANALLLRTQSNQFTAGSTATAAITPDHTVVARLVEGGMTLAAATTAFQNTFGYAPDATVLPFDVTKAMPAGVTTAQQDASFRVGMFSQLAADLGLTTATDIADLPAKLALDLADGTADGKVSAANSVTFTGGADLSLLLAQKPLANRAVMAIGNFSGNAVANVAAVAAPSGSGALPPIVADASGTERTVTLSDASTVNVKIDSINKAPFPVKIMMNSGFSVAKTTHQITLTDANNQPIDITAQGARVSAITIVPWMYMNNGMGHPTEIGSLDTTKAVNGVYSIDVFYRMASGMNGVPMGQWQLDVQLTDTTSMGAPAVVDAYFYPNVMMVMNGDLLVATGSNLNDQWSKMGVAAPRAYKTWLQSVTTNPQGGHDLSIFVATQDMVMMKMAFPAVDAGLVLHNETNAQKTIASVALQLSTDGGVSWQLMMAQGNGIYSITGLTGLTSGQPATIDVKLDVDLGAGANPMSPASGNLQLKFTAP
ncbi:MAG: hypothetical protein HQM07_05135 [Zetaproteobacteria bacterium]|nr:hypothetical protein [Zetaproteobacteria bacterium]